MQQSAYGGRRVYTPVQRAQRRMNKAVPSRLMQKRRLNKSAIPSMSETIKQQAKYMKLAGRRNKNGL